MKCRFGLVKDFEGDITFLDYRGVPLSAPEGHEWAQKSLDNFHAGIQKLAARQE